MQSAQKRDEMVERRPAERIEEAVTISEQPVVMTDDGAHLVTARSPRSAPAADPVPLWRAGGQGERSEPEEPGPKTRPEGGLD
jgi:hypothetical protein